jgi:short subunit fatty acids transporter
MMKKITENIPLLSIVLIYFGYCNLHFFFKEFKIEIYNYISNSEILLSFLPTIVILGASFGYLIINLVINHNQRVKVEQINPENIAEEKVEERKSKKIEFYKSVFKSPIIICLIIFLLIIIVKLYLVHGLDFKRYELKEYSLITSLITPILYYFILTEYGDELIKKYYFFIALSIIVFFGNQIGEYRKSEAEKIKDGITDIQISFIINKKEIKTNKNLLLIGQTQSSIFLYDRISKSSYVFNREEIQNLNIK